MPKIPNAQLQKLAQENNVSFNGGIETADNDNVHPKQYKKEHLQAVSTPAQADTEQAVASGCGDYLPTSSTFTGEYPEINIAGLDPEVNKMVSQMMYLISLHEGRSWDAYNTGKHKGKYQCKMEGFSTDSAVAKAVSRGGRRVTQMTLREIADSGKRYPVCPPNLKRMSANGKYQIMHYNIASYIKNNPHLADSLFTPEMQVQMATQFFLMKNDSFKKLLQGKSTNITAAKKYLAGTWASVCLHGTSRSFHSGQRCHAQNSAQIYQIVDNIVAHHRQKGRKI